MTRMREGEPAHARDMTRPSSTARVSSHVVRDVTSNPDPEEAEMGEPKIAERVVQAGERRDAEALAPGRGHMGDPDDLLYHPNLDALVCRRRPIAVPSFQPRTVSAPWVR